jgi:hypothetical protein
VFICFELCIGFVRHWRPGVKRADSRHATDQRLIDRYFGSSICDNSLEQHLTQCPACARRAEELAATLDLDHDRTLAASDRYFSAARLSQQRAAILVQISRPLAARVLPFPGVASDAPVILRVVKHASRWVAAAAVLAVSVTAGTGWWLDGRQRAPAVAAVFEDAPAFAAASLRHEHQDAILSEIDMALARPQPAELRVLDALTPRAGELINP